MRQLTLASASFERYGKTTRRADFLVEVEVKSLFRGIRRFDIRWICYQWCHNILWSRSWF